MAKTATLTKQDTLTLPIGTKLYCVVHGCEGHYTLLAVRPRDGYIKVSGVNTWNPPFNFIDASERAAGKDLTELSDAQFGYARGKKV